MKRFYLHYSAAITAVVILCLYIIPPTISKPQAATKKIINVYKYPHNGSKLNKNSGYIAVYYALQKLGLVPDDIPIYITKNRKLIAQRRAKEGVPATADWLSADEVAYLLNKGTPKGKTVHILDDLGVVALTEREQEPEYQRVKDILQKAKQNPRNVHIFIADKSFEPGQQDIQNQWITIIITRYNNTIRYAIIDPENTIKKDDPHIKTIVQYMN